MYVVAQACTAAKKYPEAIAAMERAVTASDRGPKYVAALGVLYSTVGRAEEARRLFEELNASAARRYVPPSYLRKLATATDAQPRS
jgi:Flp pilus assembly protein TadD